MVIYHFICFSVLPLSLTVSPLEVRGEKGESADLNCSYSAQQSEVPTLEWIRNDTGEIVASGKLT